MLTPHPHVISLSVPLHVRHAPTVRVLASAVGAEAGFDVDDIDDFRLGINEVFSVLAEDPIESPDSTCRLEIEFAVTLHRIEAALSRTDRAGATELDALARQILDAVVDQHSSERGVFRLIKTASRRHLGDGD